MNRVKLCAVLYLIAAVFGYINAFSACQDPESSSGVLWLISALVLSGLSVFYFFKRGR